MKIGILGDGLMAQAISHLLHKNGVEFQVFSRKKGNVEEISKVQIAFLCVPSSAVECYTIYLKPVQVVVSCAKGVATKEQPFISGFFESSQFCVISGPNFAGEIMDSHKTITTVASKNSENLNIIEKILSSSVFEFERTSEVLGVEICGIVKNVIAIMMGYASIKMPSWNEKSLILTKMFQEISQILEYFSCNQEVLNFSCGIGDIFLTCSSVNSRNYQFGVNLAMVVNGKSQVVEGLRSIAFIEDLPLRMPYLKTVKSLLLEV
jgi:glycerol-3-phosphate dehydrogenase (NAD(P)+)